MHIEYYESVHNKIEKKNCYYILHIIYVLCNLFDQQKISNFEEKVWLVTIRNCKTATVPVSQ